MFKNNSCTSSSSWLWSSLASWIWTKSHLRVATRLAAIVIALTLIEPSGLSRRQLEAQINRSCRSRLLLGLAKQVFNFHAVLLHPVECDCLEMVLIFYQIRVVSKYKGRVSDRETRVPSIKQRILHNINALAGFLRAVNTEDGRGEVPCWYKMI